MTATLCPGNLQYINIGNMREGQTIFKIQLSYPSPKTVRIVMQGTSNKAIYSLPLSACERVCPGQICGAALDQSVSDWPRKQINSSVFFMWMALVAPNPYCKLKKFLRGELSRCPSVTLPLFTTFEKRPSRGPFVCSPLRTPYSAVFCNLHASWRVVL